MIQEVGREWSRGPQWASAAAAAEWGPRLVAARAEWSEAEVLSVGPVRSSALLSMSYPELVRATRDCAGHGLEVTPVAEGRAAVHVPGLRSAWLSAWGDDDRVGQLLGTPDCCRRHFAETWAKGRDETFLDTAGPGPWELNLGLRWVGVRAVPHLPCSRSCAPSLDLARRSLALVDAEPLRLLLELPLSYTAESGVGVVDAGHFRVVLGTDAAPTEWADNGFPSREAMDRAHAVVLRAVFRNEYGAPADGPGQHADGHPWPGEYAEVDSALDLGAGDGSLLSAVSRGRRGPWLGIEADAGRAERGRRRNLWVQVAQDRVERLRWGRAEAYDVALVTPRRLLDLPRADADAVRAKLRRVARRVVAYAYSDQVVRFREDAEAAGLTLVGGKVYASPGCAAASDAEVCR